MQVYRDIDSNPKRSSRLASVSSSTTGYVDATAAVGRTYWYWINFTVGNKSYYSRAALAMRPSTGGTELTSLQLSKLMSPGWNLGNSLEAIGGETAWGNPMVSQAMMNAVKAAGFKTVRGGNNAKRHLVVQGFNTNIDHAYDFATIPSDSAANRLMMKVHYYDPTPWACSTAPPARRSIPA